MSGGGQGFGGYGGGYGGGFDPYSSGFAMGPAFQPTSQAKSFQMQPWGSTQPMGLSSSSMQGDPMSAFVPPPQPAPFQQKMMGDPSPNPYSFNPQSFNPYAFNPYANNAWMMMDPFQAGILQAGSAPQQFPLPSFDPNKSTTTNTSGPSAPPGTPPQTPPPQNPPPDTAPPKPTGPLQPGQISWNRAGQFGGLPGFTNYMPQFGRGPQDYINAALGGMSPTQQSQINWQDALASIAKLSGNPYNAGVYGALNGYGANSNTFLPGG